MKAREETQRDWLHVERRSADAPELNPIEQVWGNMKSTDLATVCHGFLDHTDLLREQDSLN